MSATLISAPDRSYEQRMEALEVANHIRSYRAVLKRDLKAGRKSLVEVLAKPAPEIRTMKIVDLLLAVPKVGRVKALRSLKVVGMSPSKTAGGVSPRQRRELLRILSLGAL